MSTVSHAIPHAATPGDTPPDAAFRAAQLRQRHGDRGGADLLQPLLTEELRGEIALVSSFGAESAVLLHMIATIAPATPVLFINTRKLFGETLRYRDRLVKLLELTDVREIGPSREEEAAHDPKGLLWRTDPTACCAFRKVAPLARALDGFPAWITGRKRFQATTRETLDTIEAADGKIKINPLAAWTQDDLTAYFERHALPRHDLEADGYLSIGCMPCTDRVAPGEDNRAGRWRGVDKVECGIHLPR